MGVQVRKLFEPEKYTGSSVLQLFDRVFGAAPRCRVCAIGFEPNPRLYARLDDLQARLRGAGAGATVKGAAAASVPAVLVGALSFVAFELCRGWVRVDQGASACATEPHERPASRVGSSS